MMSATAVRDIAVAGEPRLHTLDGALGAERLSSVEWLLTNGLGGYALGTASGVPTRRYHGALIAPLRPPIGRVLTLSHTLDTLVVEPGSSAESRVELSSFRFRGPPMQPSVLHPSAGEAMTRFQHGLTALWHYEAAVPVVGQVGRSEHLSLSKELFIYDRRNTAAIRYRLSRVAARARVGQPAANVRLLIRPFTPMRDMHALASRSWARSYVADPGLTSVRVSRENAHLHLISDSATFAPDVQWWEGFFYAIEQSRGQDCFEDLFSPGAFLLDLPANEHSAECTLQASLVPAPGVEHDMLNFDTSVQHKRDRLLKLVSAASSPLSKSMTKLTAAERQSLTDLVVAADAFVVARAPAASTAESNTWPIGADPEACNALSDVSVIAGYPWFGDWGRDTFISLPGLFLAQGRFDEALRTLVAFASTQRFGIIPNVFSEYSGEPEYNTVDASLWFIHAACAYRSASGDQAGFDAKLLPACLAVIAGYRRGTLFNIAMDPIDKLITAGSSATQLTWMDARRDGVTFTPRHGKPVEINALWYNALKLVSEAIGSRDAHASGNLADLASAVAASFRSAFIAPSGGLFDVLAPTGVSGWSPIDELRPNQIFAVSLPRSPLLPEQQARVLAVVRDRLLTLMGLRTLDPSAPGYQPRYAGSLFERDRAYHNGTVWPWLVGPYAEAVLRVGQFSPSARQEARAALTPLLNELHSLRVSDGHAAGVVSGALGQLQEITSAEPPRTPEGCPAQAWSVAEVLRVWMMTFATE
jgi:glycogen debranching enzyme